MSILKQKLSAYDKTFERNKVQLFFWVEYSLNYDEYYVMLWFSKINNIYSDSYTSQLLDISGIGKYLPHGGRQYNITKITFPVLTHYINCHNRIYDNTRKSLTLPEILDKFKISILHQQLDKVILDTLSP